MKKSDMAVPSAKKRSVKVGRPKPRNVNVHLALAPESRALVQGVDCGHPLVISPSPYIAASREPGWGAHLDTFLSRHRSAFESLELEPNIVLKTSFSRFLTLLYVASVAEIFIRSSLCTQ